MNWLYYFLIVLGGIVWIGGSAALFARGATVNIWHNDPHWWVWCVAGLLGAVSFVATVISGPL